MSCSTKSLAGEHARKEKAAPEGGPGPPSFIEAKFRGVRNLGDPRLLRRPCSGGRGIAVDANNVGIAGLQHHGRPMNCLSRLWPQKFYFKINSLNQPNWRPASAKTMAAATTTFRDLTSPAMGILTAESAAWWTSGGTP